MEPTNNDPRTRTMNREAVAGGVNDSYRCESPHRTMIPTEMYLTDCLCFEDNPWRAPGFAPVSDACGLAGGRHASDPGGGDAVFESIPAIGPNGAIKLGDQGSEVLKKDKPTAVWTAGSTVEVAWAIRFNHGGGYQFRICPAGQPLTEDCFQKTPLPVRSQSLSPRSLTSRCQSD